MNKKNSLVGLIVINIATFFHIGRIRGGGTFTALVITVILFIYDINLTTLGILIILQLTIGTYIIHLYCNDYGQKTITQNEKISQRIKQNPKLLDPKEVTIDEALGMSISIIGVILFLPSNLLYFTLAFAYFRLLDIYKPLGIRTIDEKLKNMSIGVMLDDVLAGVYTVFLLFIHSTIP